MIYIPNNIKGITNIFDSIQITDHTNCLSVLVALWWRVVSLANIPNIPNLLFYKKKNTSRLGTDTGHTLVGLNQFHVHTTLSL